ncbi:Clp protease ClpP [Colwellia sp. 6_MG-2023]|uniref:head maturation protease, ClpP-related n=1 Tax=Colwellia sp. 6_MG-2023 TaxID=3062676 RepID=UPI0026E213F6|nr:head maturation protease, ClpP-related [Colwellia sp. 6_MG-2023]MDO6489304.1 Clp protease ClpP [Colwellia sp. 6_MG-2023]
MPKNIEPLIKFNMHEDGANEILIYGIIGDSYWDDVNSRSFFDQMQALEGADVTVRINSYGGSVVAGTAIHTMLALHKGKVTAQIDGYAMSMASVIAMAADEIVISEIGGFMIHSPWSYAAGNADELRKEASVLDGMETSLINAYHAKTGIDKEELALMLKEETWIYAEEAVAKGFANSTIKPVEANACFNKSIESKLENMPEAMAQFIALHEESEEESTDETSDSEEESTDETSESEEETTEETTPPVDPETPVDPVAVERARSKSIMAACRAAGKPHLAENYIDKGYALDIVQDLLTEIKAAQEETPQPQHSTVTPTATSESTDIWSAAHKQAGIKTK